MLRGNGVDPQLYLVLHRQRERESFPTIKMLYSGGRQVGEREGS